MCRDVLRDAGMRCRTTSAHVRMSTYPAASAEVQGNLEKVLATYRKTRSPAFASSPDSVEAMKRCGNRRPRVQKLASAWNQGFQGNGGAVGQADALFGASAEPKKRPRTRLTDKEVDAMRTARERGVSVNAIAKQCGIYRGAVCTKTRERRGS